MAAAGQVLGQHDVTGLDPGDHAVADLDLDLDLGEARQRDRVLATQRAVPLKRSAGGETRKAMPLGASIT